MRTKISLRQIIDIIASADGLRFVVPVRTINAGPNSKYFSLGRGVTSETTKHISKESWLLGFNNKNIIKHKCHICKRKVS